MKGTDLSCSPQISKQGVLISLSRLAGMSPSRWRIILQRAMKISLSKKECQG